MAGDGDVIKKMKECLICSICLDTYTDPKLLHCHHVYCQKCLEKLVTTEMVGHHSHKQIACPTCRKITRVPITTGVKGLESAFHIVQLLTVMEAHDSLAEKASLCSAHPEHQSALFCETCGVLICYKCAIKGGGHHSHHYKELKEAFECCVKEIKSSLAPVERHLSALHHAVKDIGRRSREITRQREAIDAKLDAAAKKLKETIEAKKTEVSNQLHRVARHKLDTLDAQLSQAKFLQTQCSGRLTGMKRSLETRDYTGVLTSKVAKLEEAKQMVASLPDILKPSVEADISVCPSVVYRQLLQCRATGEGLHTAVVGEWSEITVTASSLDNGVCNDLTSYMECELVPDTLCKQFDCDWTGGGVKMCMEHRSPDFSEYRFSYTPITEGWHQLHVRVGGLHICGSPFRVEVRPVVTEEGKEEEGEVEKRGVVDKRLEELGEVVSLEREEGEGHVAVDVEV